MRKDRSLKAVGQETKDRKRQRGEKEAYGSGSKGSNGKSNNNRSSSTSQSTDSVDITSMTERQALAFLLKQTAQDHHQVYLAPLFAQ